LLLVVVEKNALQVLSQILVEEAWVDILTSLQAAEHHLADLVKQ
jgi:hypothetical protein